MSRKLGKVILTNRYQELEIGKEKNTKKLISNKNKGNEKEHFSTQESKLHRSIIL